MRNWLIAAGLILLLVYLMAPKPMPQRAGLPTFRDTQARMGQAPGTEPYVHPLSRRPIAGRRDCVFPPAGDAALVAFLQGYRGQGVSTAAIDSEDGETTTAEIAIEPGERPLYIVLLAHGPVIWRLSGATERVRHLVLASQLRDGSVTRAGVTGLSHGRVTFLQGGCLAEDVLHKDYMAQIFRLYVGRDPDIVVRQEAVARLSLPSGDTKVENANSLWWQLRESPSALLWYLGFNRDSRFRPGLRRQAGLRYPAGVVEIDPETVVSASPVRAYTVLPGYAGLQQLVQEGAVEDIGNNEFRIRRKIRLPAALISGVLLLPKGVPPPDGERGRVCVISEETGKPAFGRDGALC
jgi:hypothetical protein